MKKENKTRKGLLVLLMLLMVMTLSMTAQAASTKTKALKAYGKMMKKDGIGARNWKASDCSFALVYIDNNSVPELVVRSYYGGSLNGYFDVFTYKNGKVTRLDAYLGISFTYYKKKGVFTTTNYITWPQGGPGTRLLYYQMKNGKITGKLYNAVYEPNSNRDKTEYYYTYNDNKISKSAFNSKLKKWVGSKKPVKQSSIKFYKNTTKNRKKYLKTS